MNRATRPVNRLTDSDRARVSAAVHAAEQATSGEIVTIIAERSGGYWDVALVWAALAAFAALCVLALYPDFYLGKLDWLSGAWAREWDARSLFALAAFTAMAKFAAMLALQLWPPLRFALVPGPVRSARVAGSALTCFKVAAERRTHGRTGVLIYLSMREHRAEIIADETIASRVPPEVWGDAMAMLIASLRQGALGDGLVAAVELVGEVLAEHFPRAENDVNELPDRLIEV